MKRLSRWLRLGLGLMVLLGGLGPFGHGLAQEDDLPALRLMDTVTGSLDAETPEQRWQFEASQGDQISVLVQRLSGDLDPLLQIFDARGRILAENDDIAYPERLDAALEAVEIPRDGMYELRVAAYSGQGETTSGEFLAVLLPAYADPLLRDDFSGMPTWEVVSGGEAEALVADGRLTVEVLEAGSVSWAVPVMPVQIPERAYIQAQAEVTSEADYWEVGLVLRLTGEDFYLFSISSRGDWAFQSGQAGRLTPLEDWQEHPALADLDGLATLGVRMDGDRFMFYANGTLLGQAESDLHAAPGGLGLSVGSVDRQEVLPVVRFGRLLVTTPLSAAAEDEVDDSGLEAWRSTTSDPIVAELVDRGLIPAGGSQVMLVPESFTSKALAGLQTLGLGQGRTQTDFVLGTTVTIESDSAQNGCGLFFRQESETRYSLFFLDSLGGLGLAEWRADRFDPAFYTDQRPVSATPESGRVVLVAVGDQVRVYLDGRLAAVRPNEAVEGGIGIAALSYDGVYVNCRFGDTWLVTWE